VKRGARKRGSPLKNEYITAYVHSRGLRGKGRLAGEVYIRTKSEKDVQGKKAVPGKSSSGFELATEYVLNSEEFFMGQGTQGGSKQE